MQNYRPANPSNKPPVQLLSNPARQPQSNGGTGYGNAAKGIRPPPVIAPSPHQYGGQQAHLASVLTGHPPLQAQAGRMAYVMPPRGAHLPPRPLAQQNGGAKPGIGATVKSPPKGPAATLVPDGESKGESFRGGKFRGGGRGAGRGRGGRGRGGAPPAA